MQQWMQHFLSDEPPSTEVIETALLDYGFYHQPHTVQRMFAEYKNRNLLGYEGGVLDQPDEYWSDISTMSWLELYVKHVANAPRMEQVSVFDTLTNENRLGGKWV
jgi:hypothetical protein